MNDDFADQTANLCFRFASPSPHIRAIEVCISPDESLVVIELQFKLSESLSSDRGVADIVMGWLQRQERTIYQAKVEIVDALL